MVALRRISLRKMKGCDLLDSDKCYYVVGPYCFPVFFHARLDIEARNRFNSLY